MAPALYTQDISPPARSVLLTAAALGVELELRTIDLLKRNQLSPEYKKINPQHTIPTLVEEDGFTVWDSHAINAYLVNKYGKNDLLYPKEYRTRAVVDQRLHFDTGVLFGRLANIVRPVIRRGVKSIEQHLKDEVVEAYEFLEAFLQGHEYLVGNQLTIADFGAVANTTSLDILVPLDSKRFPNTAAWIKRLQGLPYYGKAQDKGLEDFRKAFEDLHKQQ